MFSLLKKIQEEDQENTTVLCCIGDDFSQKKGNPESHKSVDNYKGDCYYKGTRLEKPVQLNR